MISPLAAEPSCPQRAASAVRVLHCIPTLSVGGAETQLRLLAPRMVAAGAEVAIFSRLSEDDQRALTAQGVRCFDISQYSNHDPRLLFALYRAVGKMRPTVIQTWLTQMDILGGAVARVTGLRWVIAERSSIGAYPPGFKNRIRQHLGGSALVVANAEHGRGVWPGHRNVSVIGNGIDFAVVDRVRSKCAGDGRQPARRPTIITVSRLVPEKNVRTLIEAVALLKQSVRDIHLVIVGDGPERANLEAQVALSELCADVTFVGYQPNPLEWIASADVFASASTFEGHPNSVTEAAALEVPTVLSDIPMHQSLLGSGALYASCDDPQGFTRQLARLMADDSLRGSLAKAARATVQQFDVDAIVLAYLRLYGRVSSEVHEDK